MAGTDYKWLKRAAELLKSGWTWLEIAGNALQWLKTDMAVSCFKKSVNSCTWLETAANLKEMAEHCWKWLKLNENGRKWLEYKENCWKWLVITIYIFV